MKDYSLFDNKVIVIEELKEPIVDEPNKILIYVRYLDTEKLELSEPKEIFVSKEKTTLHEVGLEIAKTFEVPVY